MDSNGRRWYVAYHPETLVGVVRSKDPAGLEAWRRRSWVLFPTQPMISDITDSMGELLAQMAGPCGASRLPRSATVVLVQDGSQLKFRIRARDDEALPGEIADVTDSVNESISDLMGSKNALSVGEKYKAFREGEIRRDAYLDRFAQRFVVCVESAESEYGMRYPDPGGPVDGLFMWDEIIPFGAAIGCACGNCGESKPLYVLIDGDVREGQELATDGEGRAVPARPGDVVVAVARTVVYPHPSVNHPPGAYIEWVV